MADSINCASVGDSSFAEPSPAVAAKQVNRVRRDDAKKVQVATFSRQLTPFPGEPSTGRVIRFLGTTKMQLFLRSPSRFLGIHGSTETVLRPFESKGTVDKHQKVTGDKDNFCQSEKPLRLNIGIYNSIMRFF